MSRAIPRVAALAAVVALSAGPAAAQPPDPLDLARGLRENGMADLALEYLDQLAAGSPSPALAVVLPLEQARARLDLAGQETDGGRRDALLAQAQAEFERFLTVNSNHPRRAEATVALARVVAARAKAALDRADRLADDAQRKSALVKARPAFEDAAKRFGQAAAAYASKRDDPGLTPAQKKAVTRDVYQAELDRAVNLYLLAFTYDRAETAAEREARGNALKQAQDLFTQLSKRDESQPLCWVARAWAGECSREMQSQADAQRAFDAVRDGAKRTPAAAAGLRLVRFFEARAEFLAARGPAALRKAQTGLEQWLAESGRRSARPTAEETAARWYVAVAKEEQARAQVREDPKTKQPVVPASAQALLRQAERDYRQVASTENEYTERAVERRTKVIRLLIGDAERDPAKVASFDEALMAAQVQLYRAVKEAEKPDERAKRLEKAIAFYERARQLPVPKDSAREAQDGDANLVYAYLSAGDPYHAAVLGDHLARTGRAAGPAARAGLYAVQAYLQAAAKLDRDDDGRRADRDRAAGLAAFLDKQFPADPSTDAARIQLGQLLLREGKPLEALDLLARVSPANPRLASARLVEGGAAFELLRPAPPGGAGIGPARAALTPQQKAEVYRRVVHDLSTVPDPPASAPADDARLAVLLRLQLAELYLTDKPAGYPKAEQEATAAAAKAAAFTDLSAEAKQELKFRAEHARLRAVYGQAMLLYQAGKYAEAAAKVAPALAEAAKEGPASARPATTVTLDEDAYVEAAVVGPWVAVTHQGGERGLVAAARRLDDFRRDSLLVLALQARIKEGSADKVGELFDLMKKLGGSLDASVGAVAQLVAAVRPQAEALRKEGKAGEADRLVRGVGLILDKVAAEPNATPRVRLFLGTGLREMGNADEAVAVLSKIPAPPDADLRKKPAELSESARTAVAQYRAARLETVRAYRQAGRFGEADAILKDALGTKEKPGWAATAADFRKESAYVLEDRAAAAPNPAEAKKLWGEAKTRWTELSNDYLPILRKLAAGKRDARSAVLALLDLKALPPNKLLPPDPDEVRKGLREAKPPAWVTELLSETVKGPDGKELPNPVGKEYVQNLRNTAARLEAQIKPQYHELYFEYMRCLTRANAQLLKDNPGELANRLSAIAKQVQQLEVANPDLSDDVKTKFAGLMTEYPVLRQEYDKLGKPAAVAVEPPPESGTGSPQNGSSAKANGTEPAKPVTAAPSADGNGGGLGLVVGGLAGLLALGGAAVYFMRFRRPAQRPRYGPGSKDLDFSE